MSQRLSDKPEFWKLVSKLEKKYNINPEIYLEKHFPSLYNIRQIAQKSNNVDEFIDNIEEAHQRGVSISIQGEAK
jgi:hypothetical protein